MDEASSPPDDTPPEATSPRRRALRVVVGVVGVVAVILAAGLIVTALAGDGDGDGDGRNDAAPASGRDEPVGSTTSEEPSDPSGSGPTSATVPDPAGEPAFGDGAWPVGPGDLPPGRYIASGIEGGSCEWARLADAAGESVLASESDVANQAIVDILDSDAAFRSTGCGLWVPYTAPTPPPLDTIDQGDWVVGEQVEPGAYRTRRSARCTWARASGFEHTPPELTQDQDTNLALEGPFLVTLSAGERFTTRGCDPWTRAD